MADPTIVATVGATNANCYITRVNAQLYMDKRLDTAEWTNAGGADKDRALIMATYRLDQEEYVGSKVDTAQALLFPRYGALKEDGSWWDYDEIPTPVEHATCELALTLLKKPDLLAHEGLDQFRRIGVGSGAIDVEFRASFREGALPQQVKRLLRLLLSTPYGISGVVSRG